MEMPTRLQYGFFGEYILRQMSQSFNQTLPKRKPSEYILFLMTIALLAC